MTIACDNSMRGEMEGLNSDKCDLGFYIGMVFKSYISLVEFRDPIF